MKMQTLSGESLELAGNTILSLVGFALVYYLLYFHPVGYVYYITEDYWAEWCTFVAFFMASCLLAWSLFKDRDLRKPGLIMLCFGSFFIAMEEISWGQRVLSLRSPDFFAVNNLQSEINLHNLITGPPYYHLVKAIVIFLWSILLPLLTRKWVRLRGWCAYLGVPIVPIRLWPFFFPAIYFYIFSSFKRSEVAELDLGIAVAALSLDLALTTSRGTRVRGAIAAGATAGMVLTLWVLTAVLVQFYPWPDKLRSSMKTFAGYLFPAAGMHRQSAMVFDYVSGNPRFWTKETALNKGMFLMRVGRHAEAKEILELALAEQKLLQQRQPDNPEFHRTAGQVLILLNRPQEAQREFLDAIGKDRARLNAAKNAPTKSWVHLSLGETFIAMGDFEAASKQFSMASALAGDKKTRDQMERARRRWRQKLVPE